MLCSLGVFNAPLMNDAIFKFKRYEDSSLTYTGINRHAGDEVGGWDTTIRKSQYERLFYNQQSSMTEIDEGAYSQSAEAVPVGRPAAKEVVKLVPVQPKPVVVEAKPVVAQPSKPTAEAKSTEPQEELKERLARIEVEDIVYHKKFGKGEVVKINKNEKFIFVKFMLGEKKFMFPDAFLMGFLEV